MKTKTKFLIPWASSLRKTMLLLTMVLGVTFAWQAEAQITHSLSQDIVSINSVACGSGGVPAENNYYRDFDLPGDFGITTGFTVSNVEFGVEEADGPIQVTLNIYSTTSTFPTGYPSSLIFQGTADYTVDVADSGTVVSVPLSAIIPAGSIMVYEYNINPGATNTFFPGSNDLGQTGVSWIQAETCDITTPTNAGDIGFADMHLVMNVVGEEGITSCNGMPDAGIAMVNPASGGPGSTYNVSAQGTTATTGMSFQWQSNTTGTWQDEGDATDVNTPYLATAPSEVGDEVEWRLALTCTVSGDTAFSDVATFTTEITYCPGSGNSTTFENITNVTYAGINNTTTTHSGYNDFTDQIATLGRGDTNQISVTINADGGDYLYVFIDWNQNGTLDDAGEVYTLAAGTGSNGPHTMNITVPDDASLGNTRMRVKLGWNQDTPNPCGTFSYGEVEDYTVNVVVLDACTNATAGTLTTQDMSVCAGVAFTLEVEGDSEAADGLTKQWMSSTDGGANWEDIVGATNSTYNVSDGISEETQYKYMVSCSVDDSSDETGVVTISLKPGSECYCEPTITSQYDWVGEIDTDGAVLDISYSAPNAPGAYVDETNTTLKAYAGQEFEMSVEYTYSSQNKVAVWVDWDKNGNFDNDEMSDEKIFFESNSTTPKTFTFQVPSMDNGEYRLRVRGAYSGQTLEPCGNESEGSTVDFTFEVVDPPTCPNPTGLAVESIGETSVDITWDDTNTAQYWNLIVREADGNQYEPSQGDITDEDLENSLYTKTGLTPNTDYEVYLIADCDMDWSYFIGPVTFTTACTATDIPFTQDFEDVTTPEIPNCGSLETNTGDSSGDGWYTSNETSYGFSSNVLTHKWSSSGSPDMDDWYFTQGINLEVDVDYQISFKYGSNSSLEEKLKVAFGTSPASSAMNDPSNEIVDITFSMAGSDDAEETFQVPLSGIYYFGFQIHSGDNKYYLYVDDIAIDVAPTCPAPFDLAIDNITDDGAEFSWTTTANQSDIWITQSGNAPDDNDPPSGGMVTSPTIMTGLDDNTAYEVYVRADCGAEDGLSVWAGPISFTTLATPPDNDDACSATVIACGDTIEQSLIGATASMEDDCYGSGSSDVWFTFYSDGSQIMNIAETSSFDAIVQLFVGDDCEDLEEAASCQDSPEFFTITEAGTYYFRVRPYSSSDDEGTIEVGLSCAVPDTGDICDLPIALDCNDEPVTYSSSDSVATAPSGCSIGDNGIWFSFVGTGGDITINSSASFDHKMSMQSGSCDDLTFIACKDGSVSDETYTIEASVEDEMYYVYVAHYSSSTSSTGDITVSIECAVPILCPAPTDLAVDNITAGSADFSWTTDADQSDVYLVVAGDPAPDENSTPTESGVTSPTTLDNLTDSSAYEVYVRADCAGQDGVSTWTGPVNFNTECEVISDFPWTESFEDGGTKACWTQEHVSGTSNWNLDATANGDSSILPRTGDYMAEFKVASFGGEQTKMISPILDLSSLSNPELEFYFANVNWGTDIDELRVYYKTSASGDWVQIGDNYLTSHTSWTQVILELPEPSSTYYIAFEGKTKYARGLDIDDITVSESGAEPADCEPPTDIVFGETTFDEDGAHLPVSWTPVGTETQWEVSYENSDDATDSGSVFVNTNSETILDLQAGEGYDIKVRAVCDASTNSDWSDTENIFITPPVGEPCEAPTDLTVDVMAPTFSNVSWSGDADDYEIAWGVSPYSPGDADGTQIDTGNTNSYYVNTEPGTEYDVHVRAICDDENSEWVSTTFTSEDVDCLPPTGTTIDNITEDSADITWTPGDAADDHWEISITTIGQSADDGMIEEVFDDASYTATGLDADRFYNVFVRTVCEEESSEWYGGTSFSTEEGSVEPDCENPEVTVYASDDVGEPIDCVEEGGQYYVYVQVSGGSGNESYRVYDDAGDVLESDLAVDGTYLAGPFDEGDSVSFTVEGNDDSDCSVTTESVDPVICEDEEEPCLNDNQYPFSAVTPDSEGEWTSIFGCNYYGDYSEIGGIIDGYEYEFTGGLVTGDGGFVTVREGSFDGPVIGSGYSPLTITATSDDNLFVHWNVDEDCGVTNGCVETGVTCITCQPVDCEDPSNEDAATSDVYISSIEINGIGADSGNTDYDFSYTSNSMSTGGYDVVANPTLTIYPGLESTYTVSSGPAGNPNQYYYSVWIDLNQDGCFDADEQFIWSNDVIWGGGIPNGEPGVEDVPFTFGQFAPGTYQARIRNSMMDHPIADGNGDGEALDFTVEVITEAEADLVLGVDNQMFTDFTYYPNPVENQLNLHAGTPIEQVEVYNLLGQKVIQVQPNTLETNLDTDRLQSGVYLMNVTIDGSQKTFRIVKK